MCHQASSELFCNQAWQAPNMHKTIRQVHKATKASVSGQYRRSKCRVLPARPLTAAAATGAAAAATTAAAGAAEEQVAQKQQQQQKPQYSTDAVTAAAFEDEQYEHTQQAKSRHKWAASVRSATGRKRHIIWQPELDPAPLLANVCVVLVGPKKPISCGTVARACSCFECEDVRVVQPRCDHNTRSSRSVSKGAQYILWRAQAHDKLSDALADVDLSVAFTRWLPGQQHPALPDIPSLLAHPVIQQVLEQPQRLSQQQQQQQDLHDSQQQQQQDLQVQQQSQQGQQQQERRPVRIALVFGREEFGLSDDEVAACDIACAISIGRLQESLSLSHATSIVLSQLYQARLSALAAASGMAPAALPYSAGSVDELADGYDSSSGIEH